MNCDKNDLLLYGVTDRSWLNGRTLYEQVEDALKGGATFIQLREKDLDADSFLKEALEILLDCSKASCIDCRIHKGLSTILPPIVFEHRKVINDLIDDLNE